MRFNSQDVILLPITTDTASGTGQILNIPDGYIAAMICIQCTAASGTSPTLNVFVQDELFPAGTGDAVLAKGSGTALFDDFYAATQITGAIVKVVRFTSNSMAGTANAASITTCDYTKSDGALTAGSIRPGPIGNVWRVKYTIGGTSPSFTFNVTAKLIPWP